MQKQPRTYCKTSQAYCHQRKLRENPYDKTTFPFSQISPIISRTNKNFLFRLPTAISSPSSFDILLFCIHTKNIQSITPYISLIQLINLTRAITSTPKTNNTRASRSTKNQNPIKTTPFIKHQQAKTYNEETKRS